MTHGGHNAVGTGVKGPLDHPFLPPRDTDNGARIFGSNGICELPDCELMIADVSRTLRAGTNLVVVVIGDQSVLRVDQHPAELG